MLRNSLRVRLLLPVLALVLVVVVVLTVVLATTEARRVHGTTNASIEQQSASVQNLFAVTRAIMLERVKGAMHLLRQESTALGNPTIGSQVSVGTRTASDLSFGPRSQAGTHTLVDGVTAVLDGSATIFSRTGEEYVRISTNIKNDDGSRAIGTSLDPNGQVIQQIRKGEAYYGVVDILGTPYVTGYEPIVSMYDGQPIGIWYVGYKTDLQALDNVVSSAHVLDSGFIALFDSKGKLRFQSKTGATTDPALIEQITKQKPDDWVVNIQEVQGWGFTLVSAYPKSDVNKVIVRQSLWIAGIGVLVCLLLIGLLSTLILNRVLRPIQRLTTVAEELSLGKWNHTIAEVDLKDEIGTLARAISRLSNSVRLAMERLSKR